MTRAVQFELRLAERMARLGTETAFEVLIRARELERQGKDIIHLEIGEPDFATPLPIVNAAIDALHAGWTHYGPPAGLPELRQAIEGATPPCTLDVSRPALVAPGFAADLGALLAEAGCRPAG